MHLSQSIILHTYLIFNSLKKFLKKIFLKNSGKVFGKTVYKNMIRFEENF